jgi:hypothetical protein
VLVQFTAAVRAAKPAQQHAVRKPEPLRQWQPWNTESVEQFTEHAQSIGKQQSGKSQPSRG